MANARHKLFSDPQTFRCLRTNNISTISLFGGLVVSFLSFFFEGVTPECPVNSIDKAMHLESSLVENNRGQGRGEVVDSRPFTEQQT